MLSYVLFPHVVMNLLNSYENSIYSYIIVSNYLVIPINICYSLITKENRRTFLVGQRFLRRC